MIQSHIKWARPVWQSRSRLVELQGFWCKYDFIKINTREARKERCRGRAPTRGVPCCAVPCRAPTQYVHESVSTPEPIAPVKSAQVCEALSNAHCVCGDRLATGSGAEVPHVRPVSLLRIPIQGIAKAVSFFGIKIIHSFF